MFHTKIHHKQLTQISKEKITKYPESITDVSYAKSRTFRCHFCKSPLGEIIKARNLQINHKLLLLWRLDCSECKDSNQKPLEAQHNRNLTIKKTKLIIIDAE